MSCWKRQLRSNITSWKALAKYLQIPDTMAEKVEKDPKFRWNIPKRLVGKMKKKRLDDPLLLQFLPLNVKDPTGITTSLDPLKESCYQKHSTLLHKYESRALLLTNSACAMHCQYCFRQNYPYENQKNALESAFTYIKNTTSLREVILSGGDPLSLDDKALENIFQRLNHPHIRKIRIHSRFPIGIPDRISTNFLHILEAVPKQIVFVLHINHPLEWDQDLALAVKALQKLGIPVLSQTVLLAQVNDRFSTLHELFSIISDHGVLPYYLHQLDLVTGSGWRYVPKQRGKLLIEKLRNSMPGYCVPRYVEEIPGEKAKTLLL